jgi:uncharacterized protein YndB with AHSA1/START domain
MTDKYPAVRLERPIAAPPHKVYRAWLDPGLLRRWMAPGSYEVADAEVDERVGGQYRIWQADAGSGVGGFDAVILELVPDQRIVWQWRFMGPAGPGGPAYDSRLTVDLHETPAGTTALTLVHERLGELAAALPGVAGNVGPGWADVLAKLAASLGVAAR